MTENKLFITINHIEDYNGFSAIRPGKKMLLRKEPKNYYDEEAIAVFTEHGVRCGYVANSTHTVASGTHSAGYIHHLFPEESSCEIRSITEEIAIAELIL